MCWCSGLGNESGLPEMLHALKIAPTLHSRAQSVKDNDEAGRFLRIELTSCDLTRADEFATSSSLSTLHAPDLNHAIPFHRNP